MRRDIRWDQARKMRADGAGWSDIARRFGCHMNTVRDHLDPREAKRKRLRNAKHRAKHEPEAEPVNVVITRRETSRMVEVVRTYL